jgi:hypothetical protein
MSFATCVTCTEDYLYGVLPTCFIYSNRYKYGLGGSTSRGGFHYFSFYISSFSSFFFFSFYLKSRCRWWRMRSRCFTAVVLTARATCSISYKINILLGHIVIYNKKKVFYSEMSKFNRSITFFFIFIQSKSMMDRFVFSTTYVTLGWVYTGQLNYTYGLHLLHPSFQGQTECAPVKSPHE